MEPAMKYNGYPIYFRPIPGKSEYYAFLKNGTEVVRVNLEDLFEVLKADIKKG